MKTLIKNIRGYVYYLYHLLITLNTYLKIIIYRANNLTHSGDTIKQYLQAAFIKNM